MIMQNITPTRIEKLNENEIFVFGSNLQGLHLGGAAYTAVKHFGAVMGNGVGIQGNSYAIPTLEEPAHSGKLIKLSVEAIGAFVDVFIRYAKENTDKVFYVTPIGCGIAGFTEEEIAPLFKDGLEVENIYLPQSFVDVLTK